MERHKEERIMDIHKETNEETSNKRMREKERGENETVSAERRWVASVLTEAFDISVKEKIVRVVMVFPGRTLWRA